MQIKFIDQPIHYDGSQLAPHWIYQTFDLPGNTAVAFLGGCNVLPERMVDLADRKAGYRIFSESMLHLIAEFFDTDLTRTILLQRLLVSLAQQEIMFRGKCFLIRAGNDLFEGDEKLSVSVATASPVSTLIHFGVTDYGIEPAVFARTLLETFKHEVESLAVARSKVKAVL